MIVVFLIKNEKIIHEIRFFGMWQPDNQLTVEPYEFLHNLSQIYTGFVIRIFQDEQEKSFAHRRAVQIWDEALRRLNQHVI